MERHSILAYLRKHGYLSNSLTALAEVFPFSNQALAAFFGAVLRETTFIKIEAGHDLYVGYWGDYKVCRHGWARPWVELFWTKGD